MKIKDLLRKELMIMNLEATTKLEAIEEMVQKLKSEDVISDVEEFKGHILKREERGSTGLGDGIAMPHAKTSVVKKPSVLFAKSNKGVDFAALDNEPVNIFFMIAATEGEHDLHIDTLQKLSKMLIKDEFVQGLMTCDTPEKVYDLVDKFSDEEKEEVKVESVEKIETKLNKKIVAVTACPTGIAHTYMAEEALITAAKKLGVEIKVETNGADGVKNRLTEEDIKNATGVIVAADKKVETLRFNGKQAIVCGAAKAIKEAEDLINKILNNEGSIYKEEGNVKTDVAEEKDSIGRTIYKNIMNGVSNMLPFVIGGGILIAIAFVFERFQGGDSKMFSALMTIGGAGAFSFLIPVLAGFIAISIADKPGLMPGMVAGYIASSKGAGFLGGLIGGFVAGYTIILLKNMFKGTSRNFDGMKSMIFYPVFGLLISGLLMLYVVSPIFAVINDKMANFLNNMGTANTILLGAVLGGMMSADMGGPINKAAYTFSIGVFTTTGSGAYMAAVMAGGMVPPLAIALAMTLFKNRFDETERQATVTNYILGISFITEGAIPFAAKEPVKVIGSCVVGAALAGGLTQFWNVNAPAPHGGLLVIPAMDTNSIIFFIVSIAIGTVVSALIFGILRKKRV